MCVCVLGGRQRRRRTSFLRVSHVKKHTVRDAIFFQRSPSTNGIDRLARKSFPGTRRPNGGPETGRRHSATTGKPLPSPAPPTLPERKSELSVRGAVLFLGIFLPENGTGRPATSTTPARVRVVFVSRGYGGTAVPLYTPTAAAATRRWSKSDARSARPPGDDDTHARTHTPTCGLSGRRCVFLRGYRSARARRGVGIALRATGGRSARTRRVPPANDGGGGGGSIDSAF